MRVLVIVVVDLSFEFFSFYFMGGKVYKRFVADFCMVRIELGKRDSFLFAFVVILMGVGVVYAYNSGLSSDVMGHSAEELSGVCLSDGTGCKGMYSDCGWVSGQMCGEGELMRGYSAGGVFCCGEDIEECTATDWTNVGAASCSVSRPGSCPSCGGTVYGRYYQQQEKINADCTVVHQQVDRGECSIMCWNSC